MIKQEMIINTGFRRGIMKYCNKKNKRHLNFVKYKKVNVGKKYKANKKKRITVMRYAKQDYYKNFLIENKSNVKGM